MQYNKSAKECLNTCQGTVRSQYKTAYNEQALNCPILPSVHILCKSSYMQVAINIVDLMLSRIGIEIYYTNVYKQWSN